MSVIEIPFVNLENKFSYTRKPRKLLSTFKVFGVFRKLDRIEDKTNLSHSTKSNLLNWFALFEPIAIIFSHWLSRMPLAGNRNNWKFENKIFYLFPVLNLLKEKEKQAWSWLDCKPEPEPEAEDRGMAIRVKV